jgi:hydrogenase maturation protease
MDSILIIGYGNVDRQDDGVAWHVLDGLAKRLGKPRDPETGEGFQELGSSPDLLFQLQLVPELAEIIATYDRVCFVDAHTGNVDQDLHLEILEPGYQASAFTHHMTPQTCLALAESIYHRRPSAILVSVRGHEFEFTRSLSEETSELSEQAVDQIHTWITTGTFPVNSDFS